MDENFDSDSSSSQNSWSKEMQNSNDYEFFSVALDPSITQEKRIEEIKKTLDNGANINIQFISVEKNRTPLHLAVRRKEVKVVKFLLEQGANPEIIDQDGKTPLMLASKKRGGDSSFESRKAAEIYDLLSKAANNDARGTDNQLSSLMQWLTVERLETSNVSPPPPAKEDGSQLPAVIPPS